MTCQRILHSSRGQAQTFASPNFKRCRKSTGPPFPTRVLLSAAVPNNRVRHEPTTHPPRRALQCSLCFTKPLTAERLRARGGHTSVQKGPLRSKGLASGLPAMRQHSRVSVYQARPGQASRCCFCGGGPRCPIASTCVQHRPPACANTFGAHWGPFASPRFEPHRAQPSPDFGCGTYDAYCNPQTTGPTECQNY